jgi:hypothetical protein
LVPPSILLAGTPFAGHSPTVAHPLPNTRRKLHLRARFSRQHQQIGQLSVALAEPGSAQQENRPQNGPPTKIWLGASNCPDLGLHPPLWWEIWLLCWLIQAAPEKNLSRVQ